MSTAHSSLADADDLTACDREPIHIPGSIQSHGHLLIVDPASGRIVGAAGRSDSLTRDLIGQSLAQALEPGELLFGRFRGEFDDGRPCGKALGKHRGGNGFDRSGILGLISPLEGEMSRRDRGGYSRLIFKCFRCVSFILGFRECREFLTPLCPVGHLPHRWGDRLGEPCRFIRRV